MDTKSSKAAVDGHFSIKGHVTQRQESGEQVKLVPPPASQQRNIPLEQRTFKSAPISDEAQREARLKAAAARLAAKLPPPRAGSTKCIDGDCWPPAAPPSTPVNPTAAETEADVADELTLATSSGTIKQRDNLQMPKVLFEPACDTDDDTLDDMQHKFGGSCLYMPELRRNVSKESPAQPVRSRKPLSLDCLSIADLFYPERLHPSLESLLYWRKPRRTLFVLLHVLLFIMGCTQYSLINVTACMALAVLLFSMFWRLLQSLANALYLQLKPNPLESILAIDWHLSEQQIRQLAIGTIVSIRKILKEAKCLCLCRNFGSSMQMAVILWLAGYIGNCFYGLTLVFCIVLLTFSLPKLCEYLRHLQRERLYADINNGLYLHELFLQLTPRRARNYLYGGYMERDDDYATYGDGSSGLDGEEAFDAEPLIVDDEDSESEFLGKEDCC